MFGINQFSAVINQPQACIMAVGGGTRTVVVDSKESGELQFRSTRSCHANVNIRMEMNGHSRSVAIAQSIGHLA